MNKKKTLYIIYAINFFLAFSIAIPVYINSTFLGEHIAEKFVGLIFATGSLFILIILANISKILRVVTNYKMMIFLLVVQVILFLILATSSSLLVIIPIFILYWITIPLIRFNLDIFLESKSTDETTGTKRGIFLTASSIAWVIAPVVVGFILVNGDYWKIYFFAALFLIPIIYLVSTKLRNFKDPNYDNIPFLATMREIYQRKNIFKIFIMNMFLRIFYVVMIIYTPIYLYAHLGFDWSQIGFIFMIMLIPFVLFQAPLGRLADTRFGEKEFLIIGFLILVISVGVLPFITSTSLWVWAIALFITRIGASMVHSMTEIYFFKKIDSTDAHIIGAYRNNDSIAYIIAPLVASGFLFFFELKYLFLVLAFLMFWGVKYSLTIEDTK